MDALVRLEEVTKRYDDDSRPALDRVSLEIAAGEAVAIMGPSGSGKSTLLNLIAGLDRPTSGAVTVAGTRIDQASETGAALFRRNRVGMIFQFFNLLDDLTVVDNVLLPAQLGGMRVAEARARADELLEMMGLTAHRNAYPARLSGGERQRVAIARALVNRPALLLADEPTGALDSATGEEIGALLAGLHSAGLTLVLVTHNPELAARYASRTIELVDGRIAGAAAERVARGRGMSGGSVLRAVRGGIARRRLQTIVVALVVLISTASTVVALALVVNSDGSVRPRVREPARRRHHRRDRTERERGASRADCARLRRDGRRRPVSRDDRVGTERRIRRSGRRPWSAAPTPGGAVDDLVIEDGHWATKPGQVVLATGTTASASRSARR